MVFCRFLLLTILTTQLLPDIARGEEYVLPPIIKDASPVDSLSEDPIVPSHAGDAGVNAGNGTVETSLKNNLPYAVTDPGRPGGLTQFRGLGRSAEDTNVQSLGIPLNPAFGGGFDFSSFPQFFWSEYRFAVSPSLAALDPIATSGTISLTPWTASALTGTETQGRITGFYAGGTLQQISAGAKYQDWLAVLAGNSSGLANGPSGSLSARVIDTEKISLKLHLLATDISSQLFSFGGPGPTPIQVTTRILPVVQMDWSPSRSLIVKSSLFYDNSYIREDDFEDMIFTRDRAQQFGIENAFLLEDWKFGLGSRTVNYQITGFSAPTETVTNALVSRTITVDTSSSKILIDPSFQGVYVTDYTTEPQGSIGAREQWNDNAVAVYFRGSYSRRYPSLQDRFYNIPSVGGFPGILGNPGLQPENDFTYIAGVEGHNGALNGSIQGYYQVRDNAEVSVLIQSGPSIQNFEVQNLGQARIASLIVSGSVQALAHLKITDAVNFSQSHVDALGSSFPYIPPVLNVLGVEWEPVAHFTLGVDVRTQTTTFVSTATGDLPGVTFADAQLAYAFSNGIRVVGRAENIADANLVLTQGYPPQGRILSVSVIGPL